VPGMWVLKGSLHCGPRGGLTKDHSKADLRKRSLRGGDQVRQEVGSGAGDGDLGGVTGWGVGGSGRG